MAVDLTEHLHGCFIVEQRSNDIAVVCGVLLADNHPVAVADCGVDHGIALDLEHEEFAVTYQLAGQGEHILHGLLGGDGTARCNSSNQGNGYEVFIADFEVRQLGQGRGRATVDADAVLIQHLNGAGELGVAANVAHGLEATELVSDRGQGRKTHHVTNLAHGRRVTLLFNLGADRVKNLLLARGQRRTGCCSHFFSFGLCPDFCTPAFVFRSGHGWVLHTLSDGILKIFLALPKWVLSRQGVEEFYPCRSDTGAIRGQRVCASAL